MRRRERKLRAALSATLDAPLPGAGRGRPLLVADGGEKRAMLSVAPPGHVKIPGDFAPAPRAPADAGREPIDNDGQDSSPVDNGDRFRKPEWRVRLLPCVPALPPNNSVPAGDRNVIPVRAGQNPPLLRKHGLEFGKKRCPNKPVHRPGRARSPCETQLLPGPAHADAIGSTQADFVRSAVTWPRRLEFAWWSITT